MIGEPDNVKITQKLISALIDSVTSLEFNETLINKGAFHLIKQNMTVLFCHCFFFFCICDFFGCVLFACVFLNKF